MQLLGRSFMSSTEPNRIWEIQHAIENRMRSMTKDELAGACDVLTILHYYLYRTHFQEQKEINVKALVKTVEELWEISGEILHHEFGHGTTVSSES